MRHWRYQWAALGRVYESEPGVDAVSRLLALGVPLYGPPLRIADVGCGPGIYSRVLRSHGHDVTPIDQVDTGVEGLVVALIECIPPMRAQDVVLCMGVLQHLPDPARGVAALAGLARPGGLVVGDCYAGGPWAWPRIALRAITRRLPVEWLDRAIRWYVPRRARLDDVHPRGWLRWVLPWHAMPGASEDRLRLELLDAFGARFEHHAGPRRLRRWLEGAGLEVLAIERGVNGWVFRARTASAETKASGGPRDA